jgi:hypothetical protein
VGRRRDGNQIPQKNNSIQDSVENEGNGYPISDLKKMMTNVNKETSDNYINPSNKKFGKI